MQNFFRIGVVLVRLTFRSSCEESTFTKFIWVNSFDAASHFQLRIGNRRWVMLFGNTDNRRSPYNQMVHYDGYKLLSLFRAARFVQGRGRRERGAGIRSASIRGRRRSGGSIRRQSRRSRRSRTPPQVSPGRRPRVLAELTEKSKLPVAENSGKSEAERELRRRRRRRGGRRRGGRRRRGRRGGRRRKNNRRRAPAPVQQRPAPKRTQTRRHRPHPQRSRTGPVRRSAPRQSPTFSGPPQIQIPQSPSRQPSGPSRSFTSLLNRNDESGAVLTPRVNEPVNILPRIPWRPITTRWEVLSSGNPRQPFWQLRHIRRIWRGQNPQIAPARPVRALKDSLITVSL